MKPGVGSALVRPVNQLEITDLVYRYGARRAVDKLSLTFAGHGILVVLGQNGAGKSTTLRMVAGHLKPQSGAIDFGVPWGSAAYRRRIGYLPDRPPLFPDYRVVDQLRFALRLMTGKSDADRLDRALQRTDLTALAKRRVGQLSKGQAQRVALAQAMIHEPDLLLLDEPADGLDPLQQQQFQQQLVGYAKQAMVVLSTHHMSEALALANQVLVMYQGRSVWAGANTALDKTQLVEHMSGESA